MSGKPDIVILSSDDEQKDEVPVFGDKTPSQLPKKRPAPQPAGGSAYAGFSPGAAAGAAAIARAAVDPDRVKVEKVEKDSQESDPPLVRTVLSALAVKKEKQAPLEEGGPKVVLSRSVGGSANAGISNAERRGIREDARAAVDASNGIPDQRALGGKPAPTVVKIEPGVGGSAVDHGETTEEIEPGVGGSAVDHGETTEESSDDDMPLKRPRAGVRHSHYGYGNPQRRGVR
tara:strand:- start:400 stop:1092 length:693 start_codon:yes stop_codon:yes gene_type:complete